MSDVFGVEMCGTAKHYNNPNEALDVYLAGPSAFKVGLGKTDAFSKYTFEYEWSSTFEGISMDHITAVLDTPGSRINRRSSMSLTFDKATLQYLAIGVEIPVNNIAANMVYDWSQQKKLIKAGLSVERQTIGSFYYLLKSADYGRYETEAKFIFQAQTLIDWSATLSLSGTKKSLSAQLQGVLHDPVTLNADLVYITDRWDLSTKIHAPVINVELNGLFRHTDTSFNFKADTVYITVGQLPQHLKLAGDYEMQRPGSLTKHILHFSIDVSTNKIKKASSQ